MQLDISQLDPATATLVASAATGISLPMPASAQLDKQPRVDPSDFKVKNT